MSETEAENPYEKSADATHSTYSEGDPDVHDDNPPAGPRTTQERGVPTPAEGSTDPQSTSKTSSTKSSTASS